MKNVVFGSSVGRQAATVWTFVMVIVAVCLTVPGAEPERKGVNAISVWDLATAESRAEKTSQFCYQHHDGTADSYFYVQKTTSAGIFVEKFTPDTYPFSPESVGIGLTQWGGKATSMDYTIFFYDDNGLGGGPGTLLGTVATSASSIPAWPSATVFETDVAEKIPAITEGSVFVGAGWNGGVTEGIGIATDDLDFRESPHEMYYSDDGGSRHWFALVAANPSLHALFIDVCGSAPDSLIFEDGFEIGHFIRWDNWVGGVEIAPHLQTPSVSGSTITLTWTYDGWWPSLSTNWEGYLIERSTTSQSSGFSEIGQVYERSSPQTLTLTQDPGTYYFRVRVKMYPLGAPVYLTPYSNVRSATVLPTTTFTLTVQKSGSGSGTVTGTGISCGADCTQSYNSGDLVQLTASPASSSTFAGWTGCDSNPSPNLCNVTMNADQTVTAQFSYSGPVTFFPGGTLNDLRAYSPNLVFGLLNIDGALNIPSSETSVVLTVDNLNINAKIDSVDPTCKPFPNAPDLTINATGTVVVNAPIDITGKRGDAIASGATCLDCYGQDGGGLTINAREIHISSYCHTYGGAGSRMSMSVAGEILYIGCDAGNGGDVTFNASEVLNINADGANLDPFGGDGGSGGNGGPDGSDGTDGVLTFAGASTKTLTETTEYNILDYNAQLLHYTALTLNGTVGKNEEIERRGDYGSWYIDFGDGSKDWLEDLFLVDFRPSPFGTITVSVSPDNEDADLDLYVFDEFFNKLGESNGPEVTESITTGLLVSGKYWIAVSFADDDPDYITTNYTLILGQ